MWTVDNIRDRFSEAAEVERRSPRGQWGPSQKVGFWPAFCAEFSDQVNWDEATLRDIRETRNNRPRPPSPNAISRANEVLFEWTPLIAQDRRKLVWYWAHSNVGGVKFAVVCRRMGWSRQTAYYRLDQAFERLRDGLNNVLKTLRRSDQIGDCTDFKFERWIDGTLDELPEAKSPRSWSDGSVSVDQPDIRDFSWAAKQAEREAKRRAKLGLDAA
jgi:hypothetical protein